MKKKKKDLSGLRLCGHNLPWVESGKHLGINLNDKSDCLRYDMYVCLLPISRIIQTL